MVQYINPSAKVKIVPKDGEIEITLNVNITIDGKVTATSENAAVVVEENKEEKAESMIPEFLSGLKLKFGKEE